MGKIKYPTENEETRFAEAPEANYPGTGKCLLVFKHNRSFELHLSGKVYHRFEPNGVLEVDKSIVNHKDFTPDVKAYFTIKEL